MKLPEWLLKIDTECCVHQCETPLINALVIAWEALDENANEDYRGNRSTASVRSFKAMQRIEGLGK